MANPPEQPQMLTLAPGLSAADTHAHTTFSDGMVSPVELVEAAAAIGLSVICITDHDVIGDLQPAIERGRVLGVDVVIGEEVTTWMRPFRGEPGIHVIGLFLTKPVRMGMGLEDTIDAIHDQGGLAIIAHPMMPFYFASITKRRLEKLLETRAVDGIELRHMAPMRPSTRVELVDVYAAHKSRLGAALGASDSHFGIRDLGRMITVFPGHGAADLRKAIEASLTSAKEGIVPEPPSLLQRLGQQRRSMWWLNRERRHGRVGRGVGPRRHPAHHRDPHTPRPDTSLS